MLHTLTYATGRVIHEAIETASRKQKQQSLVSYPKLMSDKINRNKRRNNMDKIIIEQTAGMWLFKITFQHSPTPVICNESGFKETLERFDKGIKSIKYLSGERWLKMSREKVRQHFSWDTVTNLFLAQHYYFKCLPTRKRKT